jgi:predicted MFS family arabinose efflux permease
VARIENTVGCAVARVNVRQATAQVKSSVSDRIEPDRDDESALRYAGWRVVLAGFLIALFIFGFGLYGHGVYLAELQRLRGWPAALISGASTLSFLLSNIFAVFTSELIARLGPRRLVLSGIAALAASTILLAVAREPWQLYAAFMLMALGWTGMGTVVIATLVSVWFVRRRGLAISLAFNGASCGGVIVAPMLVFLVEAIGFPAAMLAATAFMIVILVPVVLVCIGPRTAGGTERQVQPAPDAQLPAVPELMSRAMAMGRLAFWTVAIPFALALLAQVGFLVHQIALLEPKLGRSGAGFAVALTTSMAVIGRLCLGMVAHRLDPRLLTSASFVSQALALALITQTDQAPVLLMCCAAFGFSVGNLITLPPMIIHREFGASAFTVVLGLSTAVSGIVCSFGPGLVGLVRSLSGGYEAALALCVALELVAAVIVLGGRKRNALGHDIETRPSDRFSEPEDILTSSSRTCEASRPRVDWVKRNTTAHRGAATGSAGDACCASSSARDEVRNRFPRVILWFIRRECAIIGPFRRQSNAPRDHAGHAGSTAECLARDIFGLSPQG